jgi:hypothetical protein
VEKYGACILRNIQSEKILMGRKERHHMRMFTTEIRGISNLKKII